MDERRVRNPGAAFLIAQLGGYGARLWVSRLAEEGLEAREVMLFRHVALNEGGTQREVARAIGLPASRIVTLVDRLEARGWLERRPGISDRRTNALFLTRQGRTALTRVMGISAAHENEMTRALAAGERKELIRLLGRIAADQGLVEGVHPGFGDPKADQTQD
jgi:DNA-binding MarR family transcriptional regulator